MTIRALDGHGFSDCGNGMLTGSAKLATYLTKSTNVIICNDGCCCDMATDTIVSAIKNDTLVLPLACVGNSVILLSKNQYVSPHLEQILFESMLRDTIFKDLQQERGIEKNIP